MRSITWRLTLWYTVILMTILIICGIAAFWGMRYLLFTEAARKVEEAVAIVQTLTGPEEQKGDYNHMDLDDPDLTVPADNGILLIQITTPDGRVLNSSRTLGNAILAPGYSGPPVLAKFGEHLTGLAVHGNPPTVGFHYLFSQRKPQAKSLALSPCGVSPVKTIEYPGQPVYNCSIADS